MWSLYKLLAHRFNASLKQKLDSLHNIFISRHCLRWNETFPACCSQMCITRIIIHKAQVLYTHISYASLHSDLSSMPGELISNNHVNVRLSKLQVTPLRCHPPGPHRMQNHAGPWPCARRASSHFSSFSRPSPQPPCRRKTKIFKNSWNLSTWQHYYNY